MKGIVDRYFETLAARLEHVRATQAEAIGRAAEACARSIAADKLVFAFGAGHGALPALEMFPRTGTIVGFRPIVESTMISFHRVWGDMGARQYRFIHAVEGYGRAILRSHQLDPPGHDDPVLAFGRQRGHPRHRARRQGKGHDARRRDLDPALLREPLAAFVGKEALRGRGRRRRHRRPARRRLDPDRGLAAPVGATSTSLTIAIAHAIVAATAEKLVERGVAPMVMVNPNTADKAGADAANDSNYDELWRRLKSR